jgi:hypothetical protein
MQQNKQYCNHSVQCRRDLNQMKLNKHNVINNKLKETKKTYYKTNMFYVSMT